MKLLLYTLYHPNPTDGTSRSRRAFVHHVKEQGVSVRIVTPDLGLSTTDKKVVQNESGVCCVSALGGNSLAFSPALLPVLLREIRAADLVHFYGLFSFAVVVGAWIARLFHKPYFISPAGDFVPTWRTRLLVRSGVKKILFLKVAGAYALRNAARVICSSAQEAHAIKQLVPSLSPEVLPNGISEQASCPTNVPAPLHTPYLLFLGRIAPEKNLDFLLTVWEEVAPKIPHTKLIIAGGDDFSPRYAAEFSARVAVSPCKDSIVLTGPVTGASKEALLCHCKALLLPSKRESFGNVVLEALVNGRPVIASTSTPWECLNSHNFGRWIPAERQAWCEALQHYAEVVEDDEIRSRRREWVARTYSWPQIISRYIELCDADTSQANHGLAGA